MIVMWYGGNTGEVKGYIQQIFHKNINSGST